jgi:hypothetical protein
MQEKMPIQILRRKKKMELLKMFVKKQKKIFKN